MTSDATTESEWQRGLGDSIPGDGNAIVLSDDETTLYVTSRDGSIHAINPIGGSLLKSIFPDAVDNGWDVRGRSGVAMNDQLVVYAVIDEPPPSDFTSRVQRCVVMCDFMCRPPLTNKPFSRVVAVSHGATPSLKWISNPMIGEILGTPVISSDGQQIFFTRNSDPPPDPPTPIPSSAPTKAPTVPPTTEAPTGVPTVAPVTAAPVSSAPVTEAPVVVTNVAPLDPTDGTPNRRLQNTETAFFTILNAADGTLVQEEASTSLLLTNHKYAPVGIARNVTQLPFSGGIDSDVGSDLIVWHSGGSADNGGETQLYQYVPNVSGTKAIQLNSASWVTDAPPAVTENELFFVTSDGRIRGWVDGRSFDLTPNFQVAVTGSSPSDAPLYKDGVLYVATSNRVISAVSVEDKSVTWDLEANSPVIVSRPVFSVDSQRLFLAIGSEMYAKDPLTGEDIWEAPFSNEDGSLILADPAVSQNGRYVYYVGLQQQFVTALKIARSLEPTEMPSDQPSQAPTISKAPSQAPVSLAPQASNVVPTSSPVKQKEDESSSGILDNVPLLAGSIGGGVVGLMLIGGLIYYFVYVRSGGDDGIDLSYDYNQRV